MGDLHEMQQAHKAWARHNFGDDWARIEKLLAEADNSRSTAQIDLAWILANQDLIDRLAIELRGMLAFHRRMRPILGMVEEMGELAHHLLKRDQKIRGDDAAHDAGIKDAVADLGIFTMDFANEEGFDLESVTREVWEQVSKRDWKADPTRGGTSVS